MAGRKMILSVGADHGGFALKEAVKKYLVKKGYKVLDFGTFSEDSCDYPEFGYLAAKAVANKKADYGIVVCKTGFGMAIVANKIKGVRSAVCDSVSEAESARKHNDCNVLTLAATRVKPALAGKIVEKFINEKAEGDRHARRVKQISRLEKKK